MKCSEARKYIINKKKSADNADLASHLASCEQCRRLSVLSSSVSDIFKETKRIEPELIFTESFHKRLENGFNKKESFIFPFLKKLYLLLPVLVIFSVFSIFVFTKDNAFNHENRELMSRSVVDSGKPVTIKMVYVSEKDYEDTTVIISIPDGVSFYSSDRKTDLIKVISWKGTLKKGENIIPFVVSVDSAGVYNIYTKAVYSKAEHKHTIVLESDNKNIIVTMYKINNESI